MVGINTLIVISVLVSLCFGQAQNILFGNLAATLVVVPNQQNPSLLLAPLNVNDDKQLWTIPPSNLPGLNGFIKSAASGFTNFVWDILGEQIQTGTRVILFPKKQGNVGNNQQWNFQLSTNLQEYLASAFSVSYTPAPNADNTFIIMTFNTPTFVTLQSPPDRAYVCTSLGDPHIEPYPGGRTDLYNPGFQQAGAYTLSVTGVAGDADFLIIQADSQLCAASIAAYCNQRGVLATQSHIVQVAGDVVTVDRVEMNVTGTYDVGNGVTVTKLATGIYTANYPNGNTQFVEQQSGGFIYQDIYITVTGGRQPTGGVCTSVVGPNSSRKKYSSSACNFEFSWKVTSFDDDYFNYTSPREWASRNPQTEGCPNLSPNPQTIEKYEDFEAAEEACFPIYDDIECEAAVTLIGGDVEDFYDACVADVYNFEDVSAAQQHLNEFEDLCASIVNDK